MPVKISLTTAPTYSWNNLTWIYFIDNGALNHPIALTVITVIQNEIYRQQQLNK